MLVVVGWLRGWEECCMQLCDEWEELAWLMRQAWLKQSWRRRGRVGTWSTDADLESPRESASQVQWAILWTMTEKLGSKCCLLMRWGMRKNMQFGRGIEDQVYWLMQSEGGVTPKHKTNKSHKSWNHIEQALSKSKEEGRKLTAWPKQWDLEE